MIIRTTVAAAVVIVGCVSSQVSGQTPADASMPSLTERLHQQVAAVIGKDASVCAVSLVQSRTVRGLFVASVDTSGRKFCNELLVYQAGVTPRGIDSIEGWRLMALTDVVRDLDGDGNDELLVPQPLSDYEGAAACVATAPAVFRCGAESCQDVSNEHTAFYLRELDRARRRLGDLEQGRGPHDLTSVPCLEMTIARIEQLVGDNPKAPLELAQRWMSQPDVYLRRKAVSLLSVYGGPEAIPNLEQLKRDLDAGVATLATIALAKPRSNQQ